MKTDFFLKKVIFLCFFLQLNYFKKYIFLLLLIYCIFFFDLYSDPTILLLKNDESCIFLQNEIFDLRLDKPYFSTFLKHKIDSIFFLFFSPC
jgi:hypothetical protein